MGVFDAFQIPYSALQREHEDVIARASAAGAGIIIRGGVARGAPDDWEGRRYYMVPNETMRDCWEEAELDELLDGMSRMEFMLRFTLSQPGPRHDDRRHKQLDHLRENLATRRRGPLPDDVLREAKSRLAAAGARPGLSPRADYCPLVSFHRDELAAHARTTTPTRSRCRVRNSVRSGRRDRSSAPSMRKRCACPAPRHPHGKRDDALARAEPAASAPDYLVGPHRPAGDLLADLGRRSSLDTP